MTGKVVRVVETSTVIAAADFGELEAARREASLHFQKFTESQDRLKQLRAKHRRQNRIAAAARQVLATWDENEWQEHAGDGELADAIAALRRAFGKDQRCAE